MATLVIPVSQILHYTVVSQSVVFRMLLDKNRNYINMLRSTAPLPFFIPRNLCMTTLVFPVSQILYYTTERQTSIFPMIPYRNIINMLIVIAYPSIPLPHLQSLQCGRRRIGQCLRQQRTSAIDTVLQRSTVFITPFLI